MNCWEDVKPGPPLLEIIMVVERQKQVIWMAYAEIKARKSAKCQHNHQSAAKIIIERR